MNTNDHSPTLDDFQQFVSDFFTVQCRYQAAIREIRTKLEILDDEFQMKHKRNPIHHMQSRMKSIPSIMDKLSRRHAPRNIRSAVDNLMDIAGIRVICSYVEDVYTVAKLLTQQDDIHLIRVRDYIKQPKANGYRSLHLVVEIPVFLSEGRVMVPVEVQIRTIAMDFWASLEHSLRYKAQESIPDEIAKELAQTAEDISLLDERMQRIHDKVEHFSTEE
jgi:putative GTP pyrophosphokinase